MTRMSACGPTRSWTIADFPLLARISLHAWIVLLFGAPSCLVTSTTEYPEVVPSPPFIDANTALATPQGGTEVPVTRLIRIDEDTEQVTFRADVRAEDNGRRLQARVFLNYKTNPPESYEDVGGGDALPPDTFDNPRTISGYLASRQLQNLGDGCYQVALVVTHEFDNQLFTPVDQSDTAMVVWWMVKGDPAQVSVASCPGVPPTADAGLSGDAGPD